MHKIMLIMVDIEDGDNYLKFIAKFPRWKVANEGEKSLTIFLDINLNQDKMTILIFPEVAGATEL